MLIRTPSQSDSNNKIQINDLYLATTPLNISNKIMIDITDVKDFAFCPYYYELKNRNPKEINSKILYDQSLHKTIYAYLLALQEDRLDSTLEFLKYRWGKEWIKYQNTKDILVTRSSIWTDTYEKLRKKGIDAIFKFNEIMLKDKQCPIIIGHKYQIEILPNIILTGTYEYVRELTVKKQKVIQVVKFITTPDNFDTNMAKQFNLELIAMAYAFKETFNVDYFQVVSINVDTKRVLISSYTDKEYNLLKQTIKSVVLSIQNNIKCISPNKQCYHCEYRNVCINNL